MEQTKKNRYKKCDHATSYVYNLQTLYVSQLGTLVNYINAKIYG